jgi:hypothetical protein
MVVALSLHGGQRRLDPERLQAIENLLSNDPVDPHAAEADAVADGLGTELPATDVALGIAAFATVGDV